MLWWAALWIAAAPPPADPALFDTNGYRIARYRAVVPAPPPGVRRIASAEAVRLWRRGVPFVDVTPADGAVLDRAAGTWQLAGPHATIAGAHWFPEAGRGPRDGWIDGWFERGLARIAGRRRARTMVIFCLADCWMSWNASLRARRAGFTPRALVWRGDRRLARGRTAPGAGDARSRSRAVRSVSS